MQTLYNVCCQICAIEKYAETKWLYKLFMGYLLELYVGRQYNSSER